MTPEELRSLIVEAVRRKDTKLDLCDRGIVELPTEIGQVTSLEKVDLSKNQLRTLPRSIGDLAELKLLYLSANELATLPESIGRLTELRELHLLGNQLKTLPEAIGELRSLGRLDLSENQLTTLPNSIGQLGNLRALDLRGNQLTTLAESIARLTNLRELYLSGNQLTTVPEFIGQLENLESLELSANDLATVPGCIAHLTNLDGLYLGRNQLTTLPEFIGELGNLRVLALDENQLAALPKSIGHLKNLGALDLGENRLASLPESVAQLTNLDFLALNANQLGTVPDCIARLTNLRRLFLGGNQLTTLPDSIGQLKNLVWLDLRENQLTTLPRSLARLARLQLLLLEGNPLNPALESVYEEGLDALRAYLLSLEEPARREELYEAKLLLVGEGGVGKTTLLKAMARREGEEPREGEPTTRGVNIDIHSLRLPHPEKDGVEIQLHAWDFGGQGVYRVTHQFFFSRRSLYLVVWEPRMEVQQCQVEDWLKMIRLRVGSDARVIIVSTHCRTGGRIAQIDKPVLMRDFGPMIVGFHEVDSLVPDEQTGEMVGVKELKELIAQTAKDLEQMGMEFNRDWREARDELLAMEQPRISYQEFAAVCQRHGLNEISAKTLASLMHDLGYIVYYGDDERLKDEVVLKPGWLTKAIGFVLEDRKTQEMDGILPDNRLGEVWWDHPFKGETQYPEDFYPFFLQLMEKFDVSYRLRYRSQRRDDASLVAQHVPQVRPGLPWLPEEEANEGLRRIGMVCVMDENPPGLVPWMIVRTHQFAFEQRCPDGKVHRLHWQRGVFLRNRTHGEAMLELRGREFHVYVEAVWPEFFMNVLRRILHKLIRDNWPGLEERYYFAVPCQGRVNGQPCDGRFRIDALRRFLQRGHTMMPCQVCFTEQDIVSLLFGFEKEDLREQLERIESKLDVGFKGLESQIANYVMAIMGALASESKEGPRLFTIEPLDGNWRRLTTKRYRLHLWCEAEGCQHPVLEEGKGVYEFEATREWVRTIAPWANRAARLLRIAAAVAGPAANLFFGRQIVEESKMKDYLDIMKEATKELLKGELEVHEPMRPRGVLDRAGTFRRPRPPRLLARA